MRSLLAVIICISRLAFGQEPSSIPGPASAGIISVEPTVFFVRDSAGRLRQKAALNVRLDAAASVAAEVKAPGETVTTRLGRVEKGDTEHRIDVPDIDGPTPMEFALLADGKTIDQRQVEWEPKRKWTIYWVPLAHHDWGYTEPIEDVLAKYDRIYDSVLRFCDETQDWPEESRYHYTAEGSWSVQHYIANRPAETVDKLARYVREGRIEVPALYGNEITGMCGHEELVRFLYPSFAVQRRMGGSITSASITDIPGLSWALPTLLADVGVKYFFAGLPTYFQWDNLPVPDFWDASQVLRPHGRPDAFWWEGPDGRRILVYYCGGYGCNRAESYEQAVEKLPKKLDEQEAAGAPFNVVRFGAYGCADNEYSRLSDSRIARQWNESWAYPRLIMATTSMFFQALERDIQQQGQELRTFCGELPHTDYAVGAASSARQTGISRITRDRLPAAEKFATMASILTGLPAPAARLNDAYDNLLMYDEHTWGMARPAGPVQDWDFSDKAHRAYKAAGITDWILWRSVQQISERIRLDHDGHHVVVFNPRAAARTDVVRAGMAGWHHIPKYVFEGKFNLIDLQTGADVPFQVVRLDSPQAPVPHAAAHFGLGHNTNHYQPFDEWRYHNELYEIVFIAADVPATGYKTYRIARRDQAPPLESSLKSGQAVLENRFYRLTVDPQTGGLTSLFDKQLNRELVDQNAPHKLNQFVARWVKDYRQEPPVDIRVAAGETGPVYASLRMTGRGAGCPELTQEIILYDRLKRVDFNNRLLKNSTPYLELYFAFPFDIDHPRFRFEGGLSVIRPFVDQFPGSNTNYYSVQHWAEASDDVATVVLSPLEAHLVEFGGLWPCRVSQAHHGITNPHFAEPFIKPEQVTKGYLYSFALISSFRTNFQPTQQGDMLFRYSMTSLRSQGDPTDCPRDFGWNVANPLVAVGVIGKQEGSLPDSLSLCALDSPNVVLTTFKQAEDGGGFIARLVETEGRQATITLTLPRLTIARSWRTNLAEQNLEPLQSAVHKLQVPVHPFSITTLRIQGSIEP